MTRMPQVFSGRKPCRASVSDAKSRWIGPATSNARNASEDDKMNRSSRADGGHDQRVGDNAFHPAIKLLAIDYKLLSRRMTNDEGSSNAQRRKAMRGLIALQKRFARNEWKGLFSFRAALGVRAR